MADDDKTYTKEDLDAAIEKETEGLKAKRDELLESNRKLKDEQRKTNERLQALEESAEEAERVKAEKDGDVKTAVEQAEKKWQKELEKRDEALKQKDSHLQKLLVDNGLTEALTQAGVAPQYMKAAKALLKTEGNIEISEDDGTPVAKLDGKPLSEAVSEWSQGDDGKHYVAAAPNSGGGAQGANGGGKADTGKTVTRAEWDEMDHGARAEFSQDGGKVVDDQ